MNRRQLLGALAALPGLAFLKPGPPTRETVGLEHAKDMLEQPDRNLILCGRDPAELYDRLVQFKHFLDANIRTRFPSAAPFDLVTVDGYRWTEASFRLNCEGKSARQRFGFYKRQRDLYLYKRYLRRKGLGWTGEGWT